MRVCANYINETTVCSVIEERWNPAHYQKLGGRVAKRKRVVKRPEEESTFTALKRNSMLLILFIYWCHFGQFGPPYCLNT